MHDEHPERPLTGEALDREVSQALAVDPSPEFVARIRQRVASGPAPAVWRVSWTAYAGAFAAAAAAMVLVVVSRGTPPAAMPLTARPVPAIGRLADVAPALSHAIDRGEIRSASPRVPSLAARGASPAAFGRHCIPPGCVASPSNIPDILGRRALPGGRIAALDATPDLHHGLLAKNPRPSDPEIIIDLGEANALRALIAGASHERVDVAPLVALAAEAAAPLQSPEIVVSPITIEPLAPGPGGEGARQ
jgi:hypothetical protein